MGLRVGPCKKILRYIQQHYPTEPPKSNTCTCDGERSSSPEFKTPPHSPPRSLDSLSVVIPASSSSSNETLVTVKLLRDYQVFIG